MQIVAGISVTLQLLWSSTTGCPKLLSTGNTATLRLSIREQYSEKAATDALLYRKDLVIIIAKLVLKQVVSNGKNVCVYVFEIGGRLHVDKGQVSRNP